MNLSPQSPDNRKREGGAPGQEAPEEDLPRAQLLPDPRGLAPGPHAQGAQRRRGEVPRQRADGAEPEAGHLGRDLRAGDDRRLHRGAPRDAGLEVGLCAQPLGVRLPGEEQRGPGGLPWRQQGEELRQVARAGAERLREEAGPGQGLRRVRRTHVEAGAEGGAEGHPGWVGFRYEKSILKANPYEMPMQESKK